MLYVEARQRYRAPQNLETSTGSHTGVLRAHKGSTSRNAGKATHIVEEIARTRRGGTGAVDVGQFKDTIPNRSGYCVFSNERYRKTSRDPS